MCSEIKVVLEKLMTAARCNVDEQQPITEANISNCLISITSTTNIDDFYAHLHGLSVSPDCYCSLNETLMSVVDAQWMFPEIYCFLTNESSDKGAPQDAHVEHRVSLFSDLVDRLCHDAAVREFSEKKEEIFTEKDFDGIAGRAATCMKALILLLKKLDSVCTASEPYSHILVSCHKSISQLVSAVSYKALFVCLEHMSSQPWTSDVSQSEAKHLLHVICSVNHCSTFEEYLCDPNSAKFAKILSDLQPRLLSSKWRLNPSAPHVFAFCVLRVKTPHLSDHLGTVLSVPLIFVDDHEVHHKCLGLRLIQHIVANVSRAELRWYGRADVLYDLLSKQLHSGETEVLKLAIPCMFAVLDVVEKSPLVPDHVRQEGKHDEVFRVYVRNMSLETTIALRRVYSSHLPAIIAKLGITILKHMEQVLGVIACYLEVYDGPGEACRIDALEALQTLMCQAWPRISSHCHVIVQSLVRLIYNISAERTLTPVDVNHHILDRAVNCLKLLKQICPDKIEELIITLRTLNMNEAVNDCLAQVLQFQPSRVNLTSDSGSGLF